jgi:NADH-quinone oxidoreductase subunit G
MDKMNAEWWPVQPGAEAVALRQLLAGEQAAETLAALRQPGAVILIGERMAGVPGALSAAAELASSTGARLGWVPRRAGERGALDAGALAGLLPGGRPADDARARDEVAAVWGVDPSSLPTGGRAGQALIDAILGDTGRVDREEARHIDALLVAGLEVADHPRADDLRRAIANVPFVVALSAHHNDVTEAADVVFPIAVVSEKAGSFTDWEGRTKPFSAAIHGAQPIPDGRVLAMMADVLDVPFGSGDVGALRSELDRLGSWSGARPAAPAVAPAPVDGVGTVALATWRLLLDAGALQEGEPHLAATARPTEALMGAETARALGLAQASSVVVATDQGAIELPLRLADIVDGAVWIPMTSEGSRALAIGASHGTRVRVTGGGA